MKKAFSILLALLLVLISTSSAMAVSAEGTILEYAYTDYFQLAVAVSKLSGSSLRFEATIDGSESKEIALTELDRSKIGHIIVVDAASYYNPNYRNITTEHIRQILSAYINAIDPNNWVKFYIAKSSMVQPTGYMTTNQARTFIESLNLETEASANINTAINLAFQEASAIYSGADEPYFKHVFVLADPAVDLNTSESSSLQSATSIRSSGSYAFPCLVTTIYQESFLNGNTRDHATAIRRGLNNFMAFAIENEGSYVQIQHKLDEDMNVSPLIESVAEQARQIAYYTLDFSVLHPDIDYSLDNHELLITANGRQNTTVRKAITFSSEAFPEPLTTPTPSPVAATPTPSPSPTPVVIPDAKSNEARIAIRSLINLGYLPKDKIPGEFDDESINALMNFCKVNQLPETDSIDNTLYAFLTSDKALPMPTATPTLTPEATPTPEPTPEPTPVPRVMPGASDSNAMIAIRRLIDLYYLQGAPGNFDSFDTDCVMAFMDFCEDNDLEPQNSINELAWTVLTGARTQPKATATPVPTPTPAVAVTLPPEGYQLNDHDSGSSSFIAQMQAVLENLNCYTSPKTVGILDQPTMDAIHLYCETYSIINSYSGKVEKSIISDILTNGPSRIPFTPPAPSLSEKFGSFLQQHVFNLGNFNVQMWMLLVVVALLLFVILLLIILMRPAKQPSGDEFSYTPSTKVSDTPLKEETGPSEDKTRPRSESTFLESNDDATLKMGAGVNVVFNISGGVSAGVRTALVTDQDFVIGRAAECDLQLDKDATVSRKHVVLTYSNGQIEIRNMSTVNPAKVNSQPLSSGNGASTNDVTIPVTAQYSSAKTYLFRGDVIEIGSYRITIDC